MSSAEQDIWEQSRDLRSDCHRTHIILDPGILHMKLFPQLGFSLELIQRCVVIWGI